MPKLVKKFAFVSTSFYDRDCGEYKSFYVNFNLYNKLWKDLFDKERENAQKKTLENLRPELERKLKGFIEEKLSSEYIQHFSIKDCHEAWLEKDLIIENYLMED